MPTEPWCPERESNPQTLGFKPSRSAWLAYLGRSGPGRTRTVDRHLVRVLPSPLGYRTAFISVESPGVAPGSPACGAGVVLLDHDPNVSLQRKPWGSNPQAANTPPPAFQAGSSPIRMASVTAVHQGGSRGTRTHKRLLAATCFQDRLLIRPDGFRGQAAEAGIEPA